MPSRPVDVYVRVSRVGGREHLISPEEQERRARTLAKERGLSVGSVLVDLDESGGKLERPGLQEALRRVEQGESSGIIVAWLDRLSRDSEHALGLVRRISEAGGAIYAPDAPADWRTPEGELQAGIVFAFAQYVRQRARAGFERAKERSIAAGIPINSRAAVGYRKGPDRRLVPDPATAPHVRRVFEMRARGEGPTAIAEYLAANDVRTSQGSRTWSKAAVQQLIRNRVYLGELSYGKDRRYVNPAAHEPIVDSPTWHLAQHPNPAPRRGRDGGGSRYLLSGLIRCAGCGHVLQGTNDAHGHRIYRCIRRHAGGICPEPTRIRAERAEEATVADFHKHAPRLSARGHQATTTQLREARERAEALRRTLAQWTSPQMQATIGDLDVYAAGIRERVEALAECEAALAVLESESAESGAIGDVALLEAFDRASVPDRNALLRTQYDCLVLRRKPDTLTAYPRGTAPTNMPRRSYRRDPTLVPFGEDVPDGVRVLPL